MVCIHRLKRVVSVFRATLTSGVHEKSRIIIVSGKATLPELSGSPLLIYMHNTLSFCWYEKLKFALIQLNVPKMILQLVQVEHFPFGWGCIVGLPIQAITAHDLEFRGIMESFAYRDLFWFLMETLQLQRRCQF
jgi:hypothetical protein